MKYFLLGLSLFGLSTCTSAPKYEVPKEKQIRIRRAALDSIRYRWPEVYVDDPSFFYSQPDKGFPRCWGHNDLMPDTFTPPKVKATNDCLNSIKTGSVRYNLILENRPRLELIPDEDNPKCIAETLATIPIAREIFFLGEEDRPVSERTHLGLECAAAGLNLANREVLDIKPFWNRFKFGIDFPLSRPLADERDLAWFIAVMHFKFYLREDKGGRFVEALRVPESFCNRCYEKDPSYWPMKTLKVQPVLWP